MLSVTVLFLLISSALALFTPSDDVIELTPTTFSQIQSSSDLWLIEFYAPWCGHCQNLAPEWKKAATALKGVVKIGAVDMDKHPELGQPYNIQGFPTIKVFGERKSSPQDYNGGRSASAIVDVALQHLQAMVRGRLNPGGSSSGGGSSGGGSGGSGGGSGNDVVELTDSNFDQAVLQSDDLWLVEFFAPWCGHCKNLKPQWEQAASELKGKVKVGAVDATVHSNLASKYGVRGYPTIKFFGGNKMSPEDYDGGRTSEDIVRWALDKLTDAIPPPELVEVTNEKTLASACNDHPLCVISVVPHILDCQAKCRNDYMNLVRKMGERYKKNMWGWVWVEAGAQPDLESSLGIGGFGYPAMAAMNTRKMMYAVLRGPFSETGLHEFLRDLALGRGATGPVKDGKLPPIQATEPWDGQDGKPPEEEEIDLSELGIDTGKKEEL